MHQDIVPTRSKNTVPLSTIDIKEQNPYTPINIKRKLLSDLIKAVCQEEEAPIQCEIPIMQLFNSQLMDEYPEYLERLP